MVKPGPRQTGPQLKATLYGLEVEVWLAKTLLIVVGAVVMFGTSYASDDVPPDRKAQFITKANMNAVLSFLEAYEAEHLQFPPDLRTLFVTYAIEEKWMLDGWSRPFYYFSTGRSYVLASFGKSGTPTPKSPEAKLHAAKGDFEADVVLVNGEWAQLPWNITE